MATEAHAGQARKASGLPYITHPVAVTMLLQRFGFDDESTLAAALLHDVIEDTDVTAADLAAQFPPEVIELVGYLTEQKRDETGRKRKWEDRKRDHIAHIAAAPLAARAIALADKLHNLSTMAFDIDAGQQLTGRFNATLDRIVWYYESMIAAAASNDAALRPLRDAALEALDDIRQRTT